LSLNKHTLQIVLLGIDILRSSFTPGTPSHNGTPRTLHYNV
jgi:hypothetical protein